MSNPTDYSKILYQAYDKFILPLGGKKVPTPYRRNEIGSFQKIGPEFQGKSSPEVLTETTVKLAKAQQFDLDRASTKEIRQFMAQNKLGIDCSGFAYRMLNFLTEELGLGNLEKVAGLPHVGRTNVAKLTSDEFTMPILDFALAKTGDLIKLNSGKDILHCAVILCSQEGIITYAHSSSDTNPNGIHQGQMKGGELPDDLMVSSYNPDLGDGIKRLKILMK